MMMMIIIIIIIRRRSRQLTVALSTPPFTANDVAARRVTLHPVGMVERIVMNIYAQAGLTIMT